MLRFRLITLVLFTSALVSLASGVHAGDNFTAERRAQIFESVHNAIQKQSPAIKALYDLELSKSPGLSGVVVLEITIAPTGEVTRCVVESSTLNAPYVLERLPTIVRSINFGKLTSTELVLTYPFQFLPN